MNKLLGNIDPKSLAIMAGVSAVTCFVMHKFIFQPKNTATNVEA